MKFRIFKAIKTLFLISGLSSSFLISQTSDLDQILSQVNDIGVSFTEILAQGNAYAFPQSAAAGTLAPLKYGKQSRAVNVYFRFPFTITAGLINQEEVGCVTAYMEIRYGITQSLRYEE